MLRKHEDIRLGRPLAIAVLLSLALATTVGAARNGGSNTGPTFFDSSGESVGSLPITQGAPCEPWCHRPAILLETARETIDDVLLGFDGELAGVGVSFEDDGTHRFAFYGSDFELWLDRSLIESGAVEVRIQIGPVFEGGVFAHAHEGISSGLQPLPAALDLDPGYSQALIANLFAIDPLTTHMVSPRGAYTRVSMQALGGVVLLGQTHLLEGRTR